MSTDALVYHHDKAKDYLSRASESEDQETAARYIAIAEQHLAWYRELKPNSSRYGGMTTYNGVMPV